MTLPPELQAALLDRRVVFLRGRLDDALANNVIAQLILASRLDSTTSIELYIDSPGGRLSAALALHDFLRTLGMLVSTTCTGTAGGAAVLVLAAGTRGRRLAMPHARIRLGDERVDVAPGGSRDPAAQAEEARLATARWRAALIQLTTQTPAQLATDLATGRWLTASEALAYGLIDQIVPSPITSA
jgi:ATP-dependent Clp protease protease subunit